MIDRNRVARIFRKELLHIFRGNLIFLLIGPPILQTILFGYVVTTEVKHIPLLIVDRSRSSHSRLLIDKFTHTDYFDVVGVSSDRGDIRRSLTRGTARCALAIPEDFNEKIAKGKKTTLQFITDGSDSNVGGIAVNYGSIIIADFSQGVFSRRLRQVELSLGRLPSARLEERIWFNPELKSVDTMIPGVIGMILLIITSLVASLSLVREKEYGNIEQLVVTPIKPFELLLGKIAPYLIIGCADILLITGVGLLVFQVPFHGNFALLLALSLIVIVVNLGAGIFISTVSNTQQQAMVTAMLFMLSNILLSGFIFPINNMPEALQYLTYLMPLRYYLEILRGIFLKGLGFQELLPQAAILALYAAAIFTLAVKKFRKTVG